MQKTSITNPVDWKMALSLVGNNLEIARTLLEMFIQKLPQDMHNIELTYAQKDTHALIQQLHHMHGALCYLGLPKLKNIVKEFEENLKNNILENAPQFMESLQQEVNSIMNYTELFYRESPPSQI